ncbi:MAG: DUF1579 domain-containing protein [Phycisphaerales bacterium JB039]
MRRGLFAAAALAALAGTIVVAQPAGDGQPQFKLPPGWTEADMQQHMQACTEAGTPGEMHQHLAEAIGVWSGQCTIWMAPGAEPIESECVSTVSSMMDGRFIKCEMTGDMAGMGPFSGFGISGFDNVSQQFQSTWIDNCGTGMMVGTGELSSDHKTMTWTFKYNCPVTKKPVTWRQVERRTGKSTMTMEMYGPDAKTGKEFKVMEISFTRKSATASVSG